MKTAHNVHTIYNTTDLVSATEKIVLATATDIFSVTVYRKKWWSMGKWVQVFYFWGFSGMAKQLLLNLNDWLEVYNGESV